MRTPTRPLAVRAIAAAVAVIALLLVAASEAQAFVYFASVTENPGHTIGRANLDGTGANLTFISNAQSPCGIDADAAHLYWANNFNGTGTNTIGRSNIDGSAVDQSFIEGARSPCGVAADGAHVYWANTSGPVECMSFCTSIGRANLDGSGVTQTFIAGLGQATGVAVDGGHVYWTDRGGTIGRANLNGTNVDPNFITGLDEPRSLAVNGTHIYWGSWSSRTLGRANLNGTGVNEDLITIPIVDGAVITPCAVALDSTKVYWAYQTNRLNIGRANLDGTNVDLNFIAPSGGCGVAIDALRPSTTTIVPAAAGARPFGEVLSFTAKVSGSGPGTPTGTVRFQVDGFPSDSSVALDANGEAHLAAFVDVGGDVSARYSGDSGYETSSTRIAPSVRAAATSTALQSSANPAVAGSEVTILATVSNTENDFVPFGSVQFLVDGEPVIEPLELDDGQAGIVASALPPGAYDVRALYHDDTAAVPDFLDSQAAMTLRVAAATTPLAPPPPPGPPTITAIAPAASNAFALLSRTVSSNGVIRLRVRASDPGTYRATATRCSLSRSRCSASSPAYGTGRTTARAGRTITLSVRSNALARAALARGRSIRVTVAVSFQSSKGGSARTKRTSVRVKGRRPALR